VGARFSALVQTGQGMALTTHPYLALTLKSRAIPLRALWAFMASYRAEFTFFSLYLQISIAAVESMPVPTT